MPSKSPPGRQQPEPWWLHLPWAKIALASSLGVIWWKEDPAGVIVAARSLAPYVATGLGAGAAIWWALHRPAWQTGEDLACGRYVTGLPGSGKTALAYLLIRRAIEAGHDFCWMSIKGAQGLLPYLPPPPPGRVVLFNPAGDRPRGLNLFRLYRGDALEREQVADQTVTLFKRLHPALSGNMGELLRMAVLALLQASQARREEVTPWELYRFFAQPAYREQVLAAVPFEPIRDAFAEDAQEGRTLAAVLRQVRRSVVSESLLVALSQADGIDLAQVLEGGHWLICDVSEADLGPEAAAYLLEVVATRLQLLTPRRSSRQPFHVFADEFQRYVTPSFARALEISREYRVCWTLIHQSHGGQLADAPAVAAAVGLAGSHYYFQQAPGRDAKRAAEITGRDDLDFSHLPKRVYVCRERVQGEAIVAHRRTPDLPAPEPGLAARLVANAMHGQRSRFETLAAVQNRSEGRGRLWA